jgi:hypothetical protein
MYFFNVLEAESKIKALVSDEGFLTASSHGRRVKSGEGGTERERERERDAELILL